MRLKPQLIYLFLRVFSSTTTELVDGFAGLLLAQEEGRLFVRGIRKDSPAERCGQIHVSDELIKIDGKDTVGKVRLGVRVCTLV